MKKTVLMVMSALVLAGGVYGQQGTKVDTLLDNQKKMLDNQQRILQQTKIVDPLAGKHFGIEFNPALLLAGLGNDVLYLSGGFSLFNMAPQAELAFPIFYRNYQNENEKLLTADIHYRLFFNKVKRGFYASAGLRYAQLQGKEEDGDIFGDKDDNLKQVTIHKFGAFFGIGYRYFSKIGIYWGTGLILGTYFSDDSDKIKGAFMDQGKFLFDIELLKIGYAF